MKTNFDNLAFLSSLTPNLDQLNNLELQRNIAIGISLLFIGATVFYVYRAHKLNSELTGVKNAMPVINNEEPQKLN